MLGELEILRQKLNEVDEKLVGLFIERMELVTKVGEYKAEKNLKIYDSVREKEIIERFANGVKVDFDIKYVEQFLENLMFLSRRAQVDIIGRKQKPIKLESPNAAITIGYQGMPGCYSHQTGLEYFGEEVGTLSCHSFRDVFEALAKGKMQYGILPIENSTSGSINDVYDLLREYEFHIIGEKCLKVEHSLLAVKGADLSDIREVYSHQQGLNIQDNRNNSTRFVIISKGTFEDEKADKVSVVVSVPHRPGSLYGILKHFAKGNCNLLKIESRPLEGKAWEYFFYIDFSGNVDEESTRSILADIEKESSYFRLLGNYRSEDSCRL